MPLIARASIECRAMTHVLLVCMANVCRSPMACAVARQLAHTQGRGAQLHFDSAGTHAHSGKRLDARAKEVLLKHQYSLPKTRSRGVTAQDFERFDLILAMDEANLAALQRQCPVARHGKLRLLLSYAPELGRFEVPDPYYGDLAGFERVLNLCETAVSGMLKQV
jgi:protein-tyrosine phosphatase